MHKEDKGYFETVEHGPHANMTDATRAGCEQRMDHLLEDIKGVLRPLTDENGTVNRDDLGKFLPGEVAGALEFLQQGPEKIMEQMCPEHAGQAFIQAADVITAYHASMQVMQ